MTRQAEILIELFKTLSDEDKCMVLSRLQTENQDYLPPARKMTYQEKIRHMAWQFNEATPLDGAKRRKRAKKK